MNKWVVLTLIFLIILTGIVLSIDTSRNKVITITNQTLKIVNSADFSNSDVKIKDTKINTENQINSIQTQETQTTKTTTKLSNQDLMDIKFNKLLNKKSEVISIWDKPNNKDVQFNTKTQENKLTTKIDTQNIKTKTQETDIKIQNQKEKDSKITPTKTDTKQTETNITTTQITNKESQKINNDKVAKLPQQVVTSKPVTTKTQQVNFTSPTFSADLKDYILKNINFPQGYVINFSFLFSNNSNIAEIHIISIPEKDYLDGNDTYISHIYGDVCKRDNLNLNEMYYNNDSTISDLIPIPINRTPDGHYLKLFYDSLINLSSNHKTEQISYEERDNYNYISGMYYQGNLYLYTN